MLSFLRFWFPLLGYSAIIYYVSAIPSISTEQLFPFADKVIHVIEYGIFGFLAARALTKDQAGFSLNHYLTIGFISVLLYGITDEFHQSFVPGRSADIMDVLADCVGGVLGAYIYSILVKYIRKLTHVNH